MSRKTRSEAGARPNGLGALRDLAVTTLDASRAILPGAAPPTRSRIDVSAATVKAAQLGIQHVCGPRTVDTADDEVVLLSVMRDAEETLEAFLDHHERLGVAHTVLLDNGSEDASLDVARARPNVSIFRTRLPFGTYARVLRAALRERFSGAGWTLQVDSDELFDYPSSDRVGLRSLLGYANQHGYTAFLANMLEMFSQGPLRGALGHGTTDVRAAYPWYDLGALRDAEIPEEYVTSNPELRELCGGIRATVFGPCADTLFKYPLVRFDPHFRPLDAQLHRLSGRPRIADVSCVLYHYQFTATLHERARRATAEANYGHASRKYRRFLDVLDAEPDLDLHAKAIQPHRLTRTEDLLQREFIRASDTYRAFARSADG